MNNPSYTNRPIRPLHVEIERLGLGGHGSLATAEDDTPALPVAPLDKIVGTVRGRVGARSNRAPLGTSALGGGRLEFGPAAAWRRGGPSARCLLAEPKVEAVVDHHGWRRLRVDCPAVGPPLGVVLCSSLPKLVWFVSSALLAVGAGEDRRWS